MLNSNLYQLYGYLEVLPLDNGFVTPIFIRGEDFFTQIDDNDKISDFQKIPRELGGKIQEAPANMNISKMTSQPTLFAFKWEGNVFYEHKDQMVDLLQYIKLYDNGGDNSFKLIDKFIEINRKQILSAAPKYFGHRPLIPRYSSSIILSKKSEETKYTVVVPVDFSETSVNAAKYAMDLSANYIGSKIIFYHLAENRASAAGALGEMNELLKQLSEFSDVIIEGRCDYGHDLIGHLEIMVKNEQPDLIVMGITSRSEIAQKFVASNTLKMAETNACPMLIVQETAKYRGLKNVMLATDLQNTYYSTPAEPIKKILRTFNPALHIVNVNSEPYFILNESHEKEKNALKDHFEQFNPEFYFLRFFDIEEGLNLFADEKNIDLIISIEKNSPLMTRMFKPSQTKNLVYRGDVPVLVVHEITG